jgi:Glycosyl hydrolase family 12
VAAHRKPRKLVPLGAVLSVLVAAALGGYALAGSHAAGAVNLANASGASGKDRTVYSCLTSDKLSRVSVTTAPKCPAKSVPVRWATLSDPASASGQDATVYSCLTSDKLSRVSVTTAPNCPAKSVPVSWAAQSGSASSPSPLPTPSLSPSLSPSSPPDPVPSTSSTPPPTSPPNPVPSTSSTPPPSPDPSASPTPTPSPSGSGTPCVTSSDSGSCGPYDYADITGSDGSNTRVIQDVWNPIAGASQTLTAYNPGDWSVSADMPASNTAVVSYPDVQELYTTTSDTPDPLSSFTSITSTFAESGPGSGGGDDYEAAYDIWAGTGSNNYAQEIMIWVDNHGQTPAGSQVGTADIDGTSYAVWSKGNNPVTLVLNSNETSGTINILAALDWLGSNGYTPAGSGLNQIDFGWEICSTGGTAKTFSLTQYSIESS